MSLNVVVIEDEPIARDILKNYISQLGDLQLVSSFENALQAIGFFQKESCDLIFLDIEVPGIDGLSFLRTLKNPPKVIITTAYREYAIECFELNAVDYLLKPFSLERFISSVNKVYDLISVGQGQQVSPKRLYQYFKSGNKLVRIFLDEITLIEGLSNYVKIITLKGSVIVYQKLSNLEKKLPAEFLRVHKSFIVSTDKITTFTSSSVEIENRVIPIGEKYKEQVSEFLKGKILE